MSDTINADLPSGRFVLRLDPRLHAALRDAAAASSVSLNEYCARRLAGGGVAVSGLPWRAVESASRVVGTGLVAVVMYGSWARGVAGPGSDVDVLAVVDRGAAIERAMYRRWDEAASEWGAEWEGRQVEAHFVHLPVAGETPSGLWAEVAVDGIVLFDRDLAVSRFLVGVRRRIAAGALVRRESHGQPYWLEAG